MSTIAEELAPTLWTERERDQLARIEGIVKGQPSRIIEKSARATEAARLERRRVNARARAAAIRAEATQRAELAGWVWNEVGVRGGLLIAGYLP